jgi:hypothetical protein
VVLVPEHPPPDHPENTEPVAGDSVRVTRVPSSNACEHVPPQSIPDGLLVTEPEPDPEFEPIVNTCVTGPVVLKAGVTV